MLFLCKWEERAAFLIDAGSEADARRIAAEHGEGEVPDVVTELKPGAFAAEVFVATEEDEYPTGYLVVEPLEHTADLLDVLTSDEDDAPSAPSVVGASQCSAEADGGPDGQALRCDLEKGHKGAHECHLVEGIFEWSDAEGVAHATH